MCCQLICCFWGGPSPSCFSSNLHMTCILCHSWEVCLKMNPDFNKLSVFHTDLVFICHKPASGGHNLKIGDRGAQSAHNQRVFWYKQWKSIQGVDTRGVFQREGLFLCFYILISFDRCLVSTARLTLTSYGMYQRLQISVFLCISKLEYGKIATGRLHIQQITFVWIVSC